MIYKNNDIEIDDDIERLDKEVIYSYLKTTYWAAHRTREVIDTSLKHSLNIGLYKQDILIGFARVVTDYAVFFYLCDVFILPEYQGRGYGTLLLKTIHEMPEFKTIRRFLLFTKDAHDVYKKIGYTSLELPERCMEIMNKVK